MHAEDTEHDTIRHMAMSPGARSKHEHHTALRRGKKSKRKKGKTKRQTAHLGAVLGLRPSTTQTWFPALQRLHVFSSLGKSHFIYRCKNRNSTDEVPIQTRKYDTGQEPTPQDRRCRGYCDHDSRDRGQDRDDLIASARDVYRIESAAKHRKKDMTDRQDNKTTPKMMELEPQRPRPRQPKPKIKAQEICQKVPGR
jgi:hypothetical protein